MSPDDVLAELSRDRATQPHEALAAADEHRSALAGPLLAAVDRSLADPDGASNEDANLLSYALYLFAKWRDSRIYPQVVRWLSMPEEASDGITGDILTQHGARILAAVYGDDLEPIKALVLNRDVHEYGRSAGIGALAHLAAWERVPRESIVEYFLWLAREGLERESVHVWDSPGSERATRSAARVVSRDHRIMRVSFAVVPASLTDSSTSY